MSLINIYLSAGQKHVFLGIFYQNQEEKQMLNTITALKYACMYLFHRCKFRYGNDYLNNKEIIDLVKTL